MAYVNGLVILSEFSNRLCTLPVNILALPLCFVVVSVPVFKIQTEAINFLLLDSIDVRFLQFLCVPR